MKDNQKKLNRQLLINEIKIALNSYALYAYDDFDPNSDGISEAFAVEKILKAIEK